MTLLLTLFRLFRRHTLQGTKVAHNDKKFDSSRSISSSSEYEALKDEQKPSTDASVTQSNTQKHNLVKHGKKHDDFSKILF